MADELADVDEGAARQPNAARNWELAIEAGASELLVDALLFIVQPIVAVRLRHDPRNRVLPDPRPGWTPPR